MVRGQSPVDEKRSDSVLCRDEVVTGAAWYVFERAMLRSRFDCLVAVVAQAPQSM